MSGGGGKGGSQTSKTEIPKWLESAGQDAVAQGQKVGQIGYVPYAGPDVAAMTAPQMSAMQNTSSAASAFGLGGGDPMAGMPAPETFAGGVQGYSSRPIFSEAKNWLATARPGQFQAIQDQFVGPQSGAPAGRYEARAMPAAAAPAQKSPYNSFDENYDQPGGRNNLFGGGLI